MTDYTKATNFATKDALVTGDPLKAVKGTEIDDEFNAIEDAVETKANLASPTFTGTPKAPTAATGTNTTQIATTAFVGDALDNFTISNNSVTSAMLQENSVTTRELNVADAGTSGQILQSDGDGSFSWYSLPGAASNPFIEPAADDPTERDDTSALQEGDIYYNTAADSLKSYDGTVWTNVGAGVGNMPSLTVGTEYPSITTTDIDSDSGTAEVTVDITEDSFYYVVAYSTETGEAAGQRGTAGIAISYSGAARIGLWAKRNHEERTGVRREDSYGLVSNWEGGIPSFQTSESASNKYYLSDQTTNDCRVTAFVWLESGESITITSSADTRYYSVTKYEFD
jgi:hypothetical protein